MNVFKLLRKINQRRWYLLVLAIVGLSMVSFAGDSTNVVRKRSKGLIFAPAISYQNHFFGELNVMYASLHIDDCNNVSLWGPKIGVAFNFDRSHWVYAPKLTYEYTGLLFTYRISALGYIDGGKTDLRLLPELGASLWSVATLTYGFQFPLLTYRTGVLSPHRLALTFNLNKKLWTAH